MNDTVLKRLLLLLRKDVKRRIQIAEFDENMSLVVFLYDFLDDITCMYDYLEV